MLLAAGILGCTDAKIVNFLEVDGGEDSSADRTSPPDAAPGCTPRRPPPRPPGDDSGDERQVFVIRDLSFNDGRAWFDYGLDLDGLCTSRTNPAAECLGPLVEDGNDGVDNAYAESFRGALLTALPDLEAMVTREHTAGRFAILVRIDGYNGTADDPQVQASVALTVCGVPRSVGAGCMAGAGPAWDGMDLFFAGDEAFVDGNEDMPRVVDDNAYVTGGRLYLRLPNYDNLVISDGTRSLDVGLVDATLIVELGSVDQPGQAVITGRWGSSRILQAGQRLGFCPGDASDQLYLMFAQNAVDQSADLREAGAPDPAVPCDAVSMALAGRAYPGLWGGVVPALPFPEPCQ